MGFTSNTHWGTYLWGFIHTITIIDYERNEEYNDNIKNLLINLENCFPCPSCKLMYKKYVKYLNKLDLSKSMVLFKWSVDLHNAVNKKLNKPEWTYEMALLKWSNQK